MKHVLRPVAGLVAAAVLLGWSTPTHALRIGNPVPPMRAGESTAGLAVSEERLSLSYDHQVSDAGTLGGVVSQLDFDAGLEGSEVGLGYRHRLPEPLPLGDLSARLGLLAAMRVGDLSVSGVDAEYNLLHLGLGGTVQPAERVSVYAAVIYERVEQDVILPVLGTTASRTDSNVGLSLGAEYAIQSTLRLGLELHPGLDSDALTVFALLTF